MASIERTAYPRFQKHLSEEELQAHFDTNEEEEYFILAHATGADQRLTLVTMLKSCQYLRYFPDLDNVPKQIIVFLRRQIDLPAESRLLFGDNQKKTRYRYRLAVRDFLKSMPFSNGGDELVEEAVTKAAFTMSDPADLINVAIETLIKAGFELPAFSRIDRLTGHLRQQVHKELYRQITSSLSSEHAQALRLLLEVDGQITGFNRLKQSPGSPTLKRITEWVNHLDWLCSILDPRPYLKDISYTKLRQFAAEAVALEISDIRNMQHGQKKHTLLLCLLHQAQVNTRDELIEMFLRRMKRTRSRAEERLKSIQEKHRELEEDLLAVLAQVLKRAQREQSDKTLGRDVRQILGNHGGAETLASQYKDVSAYHHNNYMPLLWPIHARNRSTLFRLLGLLEVASATQDTRLIEALDYVRIHRFARREFLQPEIDIGFASVRWQSFVHKDGMLDRRALELCVFTYVALALRRGDLYVEDSASYADYRAQLLSWEKCQDRLATYCGSLGLPQNGKQFIRELRSQLQELAQKVDASFPENTELSIDLDGMPHLKRQAARALPDQLEGFEQAIRDHMPERHILDILKHVHYWARYTRHFGPPSGSDPKLTDATERYLFTIFGYGCNLGASQTARHSPVNRHTLRRINAQHVTISKLEAALNDVIAEYTRFELPSFWGSAQVAIADGTHVELRRNNLMGERHFRYHSYGGVAYHHISDTYIALFSNFIACGVWEAIYILDALLQNKSALQPKTLHADTHGQSEPVFGLARLMGIQLMPRMRNWNDVDFYRPCQRRYEHIDRLFTQAVDWDLIERHWQDMMQVVLSIQAGKVLPSMLLRKLGTHNRKNNLYRAFRELGRVERTLFLLRYVSEAELRHTIRAETTKIESYNGFLDWISFGGPVLKSGDPVEQSKQIKYMNLIANAIMLSNVVDLTNVLNQMVEDGYTVSPELVARLSPYLREHIRRFGQYVLNMEVKPEPLYPQKVMFKES